MIYILSTHNLASFLNVQYKINKKVDKESCQNNFHIKAYLPTEIDIFLPEYLRHIRYTQLLFSWHLNNTFSWHMNNTFTS